jgi:hypothetical protein
VVQQLLDPDRRDELLGDPGLKVERVEPVAVTADQAISEPLGKARHGHWRRAQRLPGSSFIPAEVRAIRSENVMKPILRMCLDHDDLRCHAVNRFPDPVIVAVDVDREDVDVTDDPCASNDVVDVLTRQERLRRPWWERARVGT